MESIYTGSVAGGPDTYSGGAHAGRSLAVLVDISRSVASPMAIESSTISVQGLSGPSGGPDESMHTYGICARHLSTSRSAPEAYTGIYRAGG